MPRVLIRRTPLADFLAALTLLTRLPVWRLGAAPTGGLPPHGALLAPDGLDYGQVSWPPCYGWPLRCCRSSWPGWWLWLLRLLLTGCLHEDGLGDFFDGFGGGTSREATLRIMKDSHAGQLRRGGPCGPTACLLPTSPRADCPCRCFVRCWPVATRGARPWRRRSSTSCPMPAPESDCKMGVTYRRMSRGEVAVSLVAGVLPVPLPALCRPVARAAGPPSRRSLGLCCSCTSVWADITGDCCGALFLLCELSFLLCAVALLARPRGLRRGLSPVQVRSPFFPSATC